MPSSSAAVRSLALAAFAFGAASAFAQGPNVTAFNPYSGVGLPGGPTPTYGPQAAYPIVDTVGPMSGPAFNPWQPAAPLPVVGPGAGAFDPNQAPIAGRVPPTVYSPGANLPAPPPGRIGSRLVAIPERGDVRIPRDLLYSAPVSQTPAAAPAAPARTPVPTPTSVAPAPVPSATSIARPAPPATATAPAPAAVPAPAPAPTTPAATPAPAATNRAIAITTASPSPSSKGAAVASIPFDGQSADLSDVAKSELDRIAKNLTDKGLRQIELRAFASGADPDNRKIALARALVVRSYLIDRGVKSRIEVSGFAGDGERVDIVVPNT